MKLPALILFAAFLSASTPLALAEKPGCSLETKPLSITIPADLAGLMEVPGGADIQGAGQVFFEKSAGGVSSKVTVALDKVDRAALKPRECLVDLVTVAVLSQAEGDPAPVLALADPAAAETMKKFATPAMLQAAKEAMVGSTEFSLLLAIESEGAYVCLYSVKHANTTSVYPLMFQKGPQGYSLSGIPSPTQRMKLFNLQQALEQMVTGTRADALIIR